LFSFAALGADLHYIATGEKKHEIRSPSGEYRVLTPKQEALLDNLEQCPEEVQDAISKLALAAKKHDMDVETQTQKSA